MLSFASQNQSNASAILSALDKSLAIIEFDLLGIILRANANFCAAVGYEESEIVGKHHRIFVDDKYAESEEYLNFWDKMAAGNHDAGEYKRFGKGGKEVWIRATYNPVLDRKGRPEKVVKFAADITDEKVASAEYESKIQAISRAQAIIEFDLDGTILTANENFCTAVGYSLEEIEGRKHAIFVDPQYAASSEYSDFWARLSRGEYVAGEFKRTGKNGKEIWIQASYNPILDTDGEVAKVVKFATDVTDRVKAINAVGDSLNQLSEGNLNCEIHSEFPKNLEKLRTDLNSTIGQFSETFERIYSTTNSVNTGVREIVAASDDLSLRTEKQAAALEQTAATLGNITETVQKSAEGAQNTQAVVETAKNDAQSSGEVVERALDAMREIESSAKEINQIISVIDEIAFQTNLLALNAGVEAARAGEAGQGFAVVASEVRALAQRSAIAAKEIKDLISKSSEQVAGGSKLVGETGEKLHKIAGQVLEISTVISEISEGTTAQFGSLSELNATVKELDVTTQQNAAMAEEATAACHSLSKESDELAALLSRFGTAEAAVSRIDDVPKEDRVASVSPANKLVSKVQKAFVGATDGNAALEEDDWQEF